jgi:pimeloyl-ACP methyl ester carboxylesterase
MLLTFWGRKSAAHAVGNGGGLYEVLRKLSAVRQAHPDARLLIIGHSFGGAVVYSAIAQTLVEQIMTDATSPSKSIAPAPSKSIAPLADLVVIVNPAFEAMKLRPQFELARSQEYGNDLAPRLLIVTTQSDWATRHAFPLGRWLSTVGDQHADEDSHAQNVTAVGHYLPFVTHQLAEAASPCAAGGAEADRESLVHVGGTYSYCFAPLPNTKAKAVVLARCDAEGTCKEVAGNHHLTRGRVEDGRIPYRFPILNIRTTDVVMTGHNDIWNDTMGSFISQILVLAIRVPGDIPMK